jgi:hypothetical protein
MREGSEPDRETPQGGTVSREHARHGRRATELVGKFEKDADDLKQVCEVRKT